MINVLTARSFATLLFLLFSLAPLFSTANAAPLPKWYLNPPRDDQSTLIGVGEGSTSETAVKEALNQIASKLSVTISSVWEKSENQTLRNGSALYSQDISNNIKAKVATIKFNNYEILDNEYLEQKFFVLVAVDKQKLLLEKKQELTNSDAQIVRLHDAAKEKQIVQKISDLRAVADKVLETLPLVSLIVSLDPSFEAAGYYSRYHSYLAEEKEALSEARVALSYSPGSDSMAAIIKEHLNKANLTLVNAKAAPDKNTLRLYVQTQFRKLKIYGSDTVKALTTLEVKDSVGDVVASSKIESKGSSMIGPDEAENAAALDLDTKIKKAGILNVLGIYKNP